MADDSAAAGGFSPDAGVAKVPLAVAIASVCHEANMMYCRSIGDFSQASWSVAPDWQIDSAINGVEAILEGRVFSPRQSHEQWSAEKRAAGWVTGPVKDPEAKTHPCLVPYDELPPEQRKKDALFFAIVHALMSRVP